MLHAHPSDREPLCLPTGSAALSAPDSRFGHRCGQPAGDGSASPARPGSDGGSADGNTSPPGGADRRPPPDALAGRRIGLICESGQAPAAALFIEAAQSLGAQVAVLHAADVMEGGADRQEKLARMLARLYDVIECQDLPLATVRHIAALVTVPVLSNLGAVALGEAAQQTPQRGTPAWNEGLARVRQALLTAL